MRSEKVNHLLVAIVLVILMPITQIVSCSKKTDNNSAHDIGGNTDLAMNRVGNTSQGTIEVNGTGSGITAMAKVIKNDGNTVDLNVKTKLPRIYSKLFQPPYVNSDGTVDCILKIKNSTEGLAVIDSKGMQSVFARYDANVGDKWTYTTVDGKKLERKVISKSLTDDFDYGMFRIKVTTVEQNLPYPGFKKVMYKYNHKFGMVYFELHLDDGSKASITVL